jgi:hypothetical protein
MATKQTKKLLIIYLNIMIIITVAYRLARSITGGGYKDSNPGHIVLLISRPQDVDLLMSVHDTLKNINKTKVSVWVLEKSVRRYPEFLRRLMEKGVDLKQVVSYARLLKLPKILTQTDCFLNTTECTSVPHKLPYMLTKMANAAGVTTYTIQHGFENVGLTYRDEIHRQAIKFASKTVLTWGPVEELPAWVEQETLNKCVAVGFPGMLDAVAKDSQVKKDERPIIAIFDNLHWRRYNDKYVSTFLDHMEETARRRKEFRFILKSHPLSIRKRSKELASRLSNMGNVDIADLLDNNGQELTTPWLLSNALGVITTPSTIALDSSLLGGSIAVIRYELDLSYYEPLSLIDDLDDWWTFLDRLTDEYKDNQLKLNGELFLSRVLVPGNSAAKICDLMTSRFRV